MLLVPLGGALVNVIVLPLTVKELDGFWGTFSIVT